MKCVKTRTGEVVRVSDERAAELVKDKAAVYISKREWKATRPES